VSSQIEFSSPFTVFLGDITDDSYAKTGLGLAPWRREDCAGQVRLPAAPSTPVFRT
jgi:hypothetical protein